MSKTKAQLERELRDLDNENKRLRKMVYDKNEENYTLKIKVTELQNKADELADENRTLKAAVATWQKVATQARAPV